MLPWWWGPQRMMSLVRWLMRLTSLALPSRNMKKQFDLVCMFMYTVDLLTSKHPVPSFT